MPHYWGVRLALILLLVAAVAAVAALWPRDSEPRAANPCGPVDGQPSDVGLDVASQTTVCLVNRERTVRGLRPLTINTLLNSASVEHSNDMVKRDYFEHSTPDGRSVGDPLRAIGYSRGISASAGENIAYGVGSEATPNSIVDAWMHSPGHRADILRPAFTEIGIGIALGAPTPSGTTDNSATYTTDFGGTVDSTLPNG